MEVICEVMKLKAEGVAEYLEMHRSVWPQLITVIKQCGFLEEYIYLLGPYVVVILKSEDFAESARKLQASPVFQRWTARVRSLLEEDEALFGTKEKVIDLRPIWNLGDFPDPERG